MEANLNQFRLLTVEGEQKANAQRRGPLSDELSNVRKHIRDATKHRLVYEDCPYFASSSNSRLRKTSSTPSSEQLASSHHLQPSSFHEPAICNLQDHHHHHHIHHCSSQSRRSQSNRLLPPKQDENYDDDDDKSSSRHSLPNSEESSSYTPQFTVRHKFCSPSREESEQFYSISSDRRSSQQIDTMQQSAARDMETDGELKDPHLILTKAIKSLEKTMSLHCQLLLKRMSRDRHPIHPRHTVVETRYHPSQPTLAQVAPKTNIRYEKVIVYMRVIFLKIGEIDTMKENFTADAFIQARWREPALDGLKDQLLATQSVDEIDWERYWNPKLYVENNLGEPKETIWQTVSFGFKGEATVYERRRIKGCFLENLELDDFPFDTQDLTLTITSERADTELELEEDGTEISSINVQSFVDEQEWALHSHVETWKCITTKIFQNSKLRHPSFSTSCRASRRAGFYIWNIFLVMLFICSLTFATFSVELTKPENRLQLSFILLLTTITFKFVVSQTLPRISYLTYLDKYILTSMGILCGVCVWHAIIPLFKYDIELAKVVDKWGLVVSASSYFLFHVFFFMYIYIMALKKRWKYNLKDKDHKDRVKRLQLLQEQQLLETKLQMEAELNSLQSQENYDAAQKRASRKVERLNEQGTSQKEERLFELHELRERSENGQGGLIDPEEENRQNNETNQDIVKVHSGQVLQIYQRHSPTQQQNNNIDSIETTQDGDFNFPAEKIHES